ncbi:hypothetical protein [Propionivibrio sp.]|uniref:hypothetical protein n=1 Tax=Propionivibrio sp. TaxID=2212460 RepID=UPI0025ED5778|nr:hypothetical protein [Propionivibrio sp.]MBK7357154.1 hypothetical protein [Propionivibrio sp.]
MKPVRSSTAAVLKSPSADTSRTMDGIFDSANRLDALIHMAMVRPLIETGPAQAEQVEVSPAASTRKIGNAPLSM